MAAFVFKRVDLRYFGLFFNVPDEEGFSARRCIGSSSIGSSTNQCFHLGFSESACTQKTGNFPIANNEKFKNELVCAQQKR